MTRTIQASAVPHLVGLVLLLCGAAIPAAAQEPEPEQGEAIGQAHGDDTESPVDDGAAGEGTFPKWLLEWKEGPLDAKLGGMAEIHVPEGFRFANAAQTREWMKMNQNLTSGNELGAMLSSDGAWFVIFEFNDVGYVKDDDKDKLDAAEIMKGIKEGNDAGNEERRRQGWPEVQIIGWDHPPHYDSVTNNLEWCIRGHSQGHDITNYNTRILGRKGVMEATLLADPDAMNAVLPAFKETLNGFRFSSGHTYAEFTKGDKIAEYGLIGLVAAGAGAVAAKTGLLAKFGKGAIKILVIIAIAIAAAFKKIVAVFQRKPAVTNEPPPSNWPEGTA